VVTMSTSPLPSNSSISSRHHATVVFLAGELDAATSPHAADTLATALADALERRVAAIELDLSAVPFIDSTGMGALVSARRAALAAGVSFTVCAASQPVRRLFTITKLDEVFGLTA
jgi:anti-sigma B factor antagonist